MIDTTFPEPWDVRVTALGNDELPCAGEVFHHASPHLRCKFLVGAARAELARGLSSYNVLTGVHLFDVKPLDTDGVTGIEHLRALHATMRELARLLHDAFGAVNVTGMHC